MEQDSEARMPRVADEAAGGARAMSADDGRLVAGSCPSKYRVRRAGRGSVPEPVQVHADFDEIPEEFFEA